MIGLKRIGLGACCLLLTGSLLGAEVKVEIDHNDAEHSTVEFNFKNVPSPSKTNAAINAKFTLVDGDADGTGAGLEVLHDGKLPGDQDEPASNFFFNAGTDGGRFSIDLKSVIDVKQVHSYSWHSDTRAPQVYTLYASDGTDTHFNATPAKDIDPTASGWKRVAKVDTRPKTGDSGGQYGVNISDPAGPLGKYRYLLFVVSRTESNDDFGNTFYSEINVIDAAELISTPLKADDRAGIYDLKIDGGKYSCTINTVETPNLTDWADKDLAADVAKWYPQIVEMLPSPAYTAPTHFSITFRKNKGGVADTGGTRINCAGKWFTDNMESEGKGAIIHELVHVVQQYGSFRRLNPRADSDPGWLVEGIPDYIRWYKYEPLSNGTAISKRRLPDAKYDDSYRISANFLNWTIQKYDKDLIAKLDVVLRDGTYSDDIWQKLTGKNVQALGDEWKADLAKQLDQAGGNGTK